MSYTTIAPLTKAPTPPPIMACDMSTISTTTKTKSSRKSSSSSSTKNSNKTIRKSSSKNAEKTHRRSRSGCYTCRLRRKKCDEGSPVCKACKNLKLKCEYKRPTWWANNDQRSTHKDLIKDAIKDTKLKEKAVHGRHSSSRMHTPPSLSHSVPTPDTYQEEMDHTRAASVDSQYFGEYELEPQYPVQGPYDPFASQLQTPHFDAATFYGSVPPYEVDIKTESQVYVNDVPTRRDSSISTFSTFQPPLSHTTLPTFAGEDWIQQEFFESRKESFSPKEEIDYNLFDVSHNPFHTRVFHIDECDRPLLDYFLDKVVPLVFPVLEARQQGIVHSNLILPALESNKCYLHCCLSIAAVHLKAVEKLSGEQIDTDILKHRHETVAELCKAMNRDIDHIQILEATLGMIFFQCFVGRPEDALPDIPWHQHFQATTSLNLKLDLPNMLLERTPCNVHPPFNTSLVAWIDILGSTMLGKTPQFAHAYRTKHLTGSASGLSELMGCEDRVMYLISEISCLDALKLENRIDNIGLCSLITVLAGQLDHTEPPPGSLVYPCAESGIPRSQQLIKNITALFRVAARVYLCSLVPGFHHTQSGTVQLIAHFAELLDLIPSGPEGFDRSLVWPYLICGSFSTPNSPFHVVFNRRLEQLGEQAEFGSFGRLVRLLREVWRIQDNIPSPDMPAVPEPQVTGEAPFLPTPVSGATTPGGTAEQRPILQSLHWRDVMSQNGWDDLLI
ncbi:hypothetical protein AJ80_01214 [Polytolypa hystricis UAMH7299]|uniref:Zn(2)-C6 fungal-type domain-containing protein n=1 Tax=Polytolypa hystricis (strain UAMH7299) TaxID=1447883 RepID=A0A2B7Z1B3_POLH7|nr:hypothetical protein AJ80_01214 [Polytolypa hystricis UAMH7299]